MESVIAGLLKDFEDGKMTRRQLIQSLALAAVAAAPGASALAQTAAAAPKPPIPQAFEPTGWKTVWLDHISSQVSDYRRSAAFYRDLMGWTIRNDNGTVPGVDEHQRDRRHHHSQRARTERAGGGAPRSRRRAGPHRPRQARRAAVAPTGRR